jgi:hypothetical protein
MNAGQREDNAFEESRITLYFRPVDIEYDKTECRGEVIFHSTREFVMHSPIKLEADSVLAFRMLVPLNVSGNPICETKGTGRVIGERLLPDNTRGYVIRIE